MLIQEVNDDLLQNFLRDVKFFEQDVKNVPESSMRPTYIHCEPWIRYIENKYIDLKSTNVDYVDKFISILDKNKIRPSVIRCLATSWQVELYMLQDKDLHNGRVRLLQHMFSHW